MIKRSAELVKLLGFYFIENSVSPGRLDWAAATHARTELDDLVRARLEQIFNMKSEVVRLADWQ